MGLNACASGSLIADREACFVNEFGPPLKIDQPKSKSGKASRLKPVLPFEAIVMAGGKGERLSPLTDHCPKPLLPVGGKPIVEHTISRLLKTGIRDFTFCVNYLGEMIQDHFGDGSDHKATFSYIYETQPLGTIGGARLKEQFRFDDLLVINGDLLTTINFEKFYAFFIEEDADIAIATIPYRVSLPYGILEQKEGHEVHSIQEKPNYTYYINTGIYFLRKEMLGMIPQDEKFDAVDLIDRAMADGRKVSAFPLLDYWVDIGQLEDYHKAQEDAQYLDL